MPKNSRTYTKKELLEKIDELQSRLTETEETLNAIIHGEVDAIVVSGSDRNKIFSLTSAETPYRLIIEEMEEGAVTISETGTILYCNKRFAELLSVPMSQIIGSDFLQFVNVQEKPKYRALLHEGLSGRIKDEMMFLCHDGNPIYLHLSMCAVPDGLLGKICIIATDITELKNYQQDLQGLVKERTLELENKNLQLKEINATKDKLFSIIAHDLKSPFSTLLGFSELLIEKIDQYDVEKFENILKYINSAARSAYTLLENLLLWARSQNKQLQFNLQKLNLSKVIRDVTENLSSIAAMKYISVHFLPEKEIFAYADENMIRVVIRNLISNAIKFTRSGGNIDVNLIQAEQGVEISVSDNGIGMDEITQSRLFSINSGTMSEGTAHEKGTGLGLIICKEFVEKHKGSITVESRLNIGTTFKIRLPGKLNDPEEHGNLEYNSAINSTSNF